MLFGPNTPAYDAPRSVYLPPDPSLDAALDSLTRAGVLASPATFRLAARATGWGAQLKSGHYRIRPRSSTYRLLDKLRRGLQDPVRLRLPAGRRAGALARTMGAGLRHDAHAFRAALRDTALAAALGTAPSRLFGYLLPETYEFYWEAPPERWVPLSNTSLPRLYERELPPGSQRPRSPQRSLCTVAPMRRP